jgi:hypothetical protein
MEGDQRSGLLNKGVRRDIWVGALLPSDLGLPSVHPYLPATAPAAPSADLSSGPVPGATAP